MRKHLLLSLICLSLGACAAEDELEEAEAKGTETVEESAPQAEDILVSEMTTRFKPRVTELRELTSEDRQLHKELSNVVSENAGLDREAIYNVAPEYGVEPQELWETWLEIVDAIMHGDQGSTAILPQDYRLLMGEVLEKNINGHQIKLTGATWDMEEDQQTSKASTQLIVDEAEYHVQMHFKHSADLEIADLTHFKIDGKTIAL